MISADQPSSHADRAPADEMLLRDLARSGRLAVAAQAATPVQYARLASAAYTVVWPIVFARVTRPVERRRGHWTCSTAMCRLADECLDGFHDDVEAVVADLLINAKVHIHNLEAWLSGRLTAATINGYRRRRGQRGALQRPRVPGWLAAELGHDAWRMELAVNILDWVGVPATAGTDVWPLESWALRRAAVTDDWAGSDRRAVLGEVDWVLTAMRRRPKWYADYVERPLGRKVAPVTAPPGDAVGDPRPLVPTTLDEVDEIRMTELASTAIEAIAAGLRWGEDPKETVARVLNLVFGAGAGGEELDRVPGTSPALDEQVSALLADPRTVDRIVAAAVRVVADFER